ncbi:MAG: FHA domain-containing protein [Pirellulaceae bacterium]|nr:FHA domain-containing protein [Pirellulaceae bacterium]
MQVKLKVMQGVHTGKEIAIVERYFLIGREESCHLRPQSETVSRKHCAISISEEGIYVEEFGSKNGTFVNEKRVSGKQLLKTGDSLRVGPLHFEVLIDHAVNAPKKSAVKNIKEAASRTVQKASSDNESTVDQDATMWLQESPEELASPMSETRHFVLDDTDKHPKRENLADQETKEEQPPKPKLGKISKSKAPNTQEAAEDTLRKMLNRR